MLSDVSYFSSYKFKIVLFLPFFLLPPPLLCLIDWCVCPSGYMPRPLRLTRQQIVERTTRDIRLRTEARLAQLLQGRQEREQEIVGVSDDEDWEDGG